MKTAKRLMALASVFVAGVLANSYDVNTSEEFRFNNPVPISSTLEEQLDIVSRRPIMTDTVHSIDLFNWTIPLKTTRTVTNTNGSSYGGNLDKNGNIHAPEGTYNLQAAHDSNWYKLAKN